MSSRLLERDCHRPKQPDPEPHWNIVPHVDVLVRDPVLEQEDDARLAMLHAMWDSWDSPE